ncbi:MAG: glycosyltransferase [Desulfobulbus sp.]|jgi:glycosyltransferase involved in cell wall biosynthesis|nr:glycosyltransferase [Desulfobulbus sp.]
MEKDSPMKPTRIAHLIATNFYGGPERQIINHAKGLLEKETGFEPLIISFLEKGQENEILAKAGECNIKYAGIRATGAVNPRAIFELYTILKDNEVSLLVAHGYKANVLGRLSSRCRSTPLVAVSRGWTAENRKIELYEKLDKLFLRWATHVVAVSEGQRQKILPLGVAPDKVSVIHNAIDLGQMPPPAKRSVREELGIPPDALLVCSAGRLSPEKDQQSLVEAAHIISQERPEVYFCIFGEGACRTLLEKKIADHSLSDRFFLPGFRKDFLSVLPEVDVFVLPSLTEGLPNVVLEAYAWHKPVIATSVGGTPEVVQHGETGFLYSPHDVTMLVDYLLGLAKDTKKRSSMGEKGYKFVRDCFSYERQLIEYLMLYNRLIGNKVG